MKRFISGMGTYSSATVLQKGFVTKTFVNETTELIHVHADGGTISATPAHPFYVDGFGRTLAGSDSMDFSDRTLLMPTQPDIT